MSESSRVQKDRIAGVLVPVFAIRSENDLGIGDTSSVSELIDWASELGIQFLQFLPINELCSDNSPYNAVSSVALDPLTITTTPQALADLSQEDFAHALEEVDLETLRAGPVDYPTVRALKMHLLRRAFQSFQTNHFGKNTPHEQAFLHFCIEEHQWLYDYCIFRMLMDQEQSRENWELWPESYNTIAKARVYVDHLLKHTNKAQNEETEKQLAFYAYIQFLAFSQWDDVAAHARARGVKLMGDIPFGVSRCSADVFASPDLFDLEWCGGAPPETNFKDDEFVVRFGQNWGIPLYRWDRMEENDFAWWRRRVAKVCRLFDIYRIDHALGFYRIYGFPWHPNRNEEFLAFTKEELLRETKGREPGYKPCADDTEEHRIQNRALGEKYLSILKEASAETEIVAEDLGTVPPYVPDSLHSLALAGMRVPMWIRDEHGDLIPGEQYPYLSMATYATHDHDPIQMQWNRHREVACSQQTTDPHAKQESRYFLEQLGRFAKITGFEDGQIPEYSNLVRERLLHALCSSQSRFVSIMITDLLGLDLRFNVPGVLNDQNWSSRLPMTVDQLRRDQPWRTMAMEIHHLLRVSNRHPKSATGIL